MISETTFIKINKVKICFLCKYDFKIFLNVILNNNLVLIFERPAQLCQGGRRAVRISEPENK